MGAPDRRELRPSFFRRENERPEPPEYEFYELAKAAHRAWYVIQGKSRNVIDFDLVGSNHTERILIDALRNEPYKYQISLIIERLSEALEVAEKLDPKLVTDRDLFDFGKGQVSAMVLYARRLRGEELDKAYYIENTMQVPLVEASQEMLTEQLGEIHKIADQIGADLSESGFRNWRIEHEVDPETAERQLLTAGLNMSRDKALFIGEKPRTLPVTIKPVNEDAYFYAWSDTNKQTGGFETKQNFGTPQRPKIWTPGKSEELGPHEIAQHAGRMAKRQEQIRSGKLHPFFGQTTTHGPEQTVEEGLAMTITLFVPSAYERLSPEGKLQVHMTLVKYLELGNAQLRLINDPDNNIDKEAERVKKVLTWEPLSEITTWLKERIDDPLLETYMRGYAEGARRKLIYSKVLSPRGSQEYIRQIDLRPSKADQEAQLVDHIASRDKRNQKDHIDEWAMSEYQEIMLATQKPAA